MLRTLWEVLRELGRLCGRFEVVIEVVLLVPPKAGVADAHARTLPPAGAPTGLEADPDIGACAAAAAERELPLYGPACT